MRNVKQALRWTRLKLRRLRVLVRDEDRDTWYDDHKHGDGKPPNVGGNLWGTGSGGG